METQVRSSDSYSSLDLKAAFPKIQGQPGCFKSEDSAHIFFDKEKSTFCTSGPVGEREDGNSSSFALSKLVFPYQGL